MAISSINIKAVKPNSEAHNFQSKERESLDYVYESLTKNNESWSISSVKSMDEHLRNEHKRLTGRKMSKNATPIREAVVNLNAHHTMDHLKLLADVLKRSHGISCFQIHIHRDEGKNPLELNYHAHMLFDWTEKESKEIKQPRKQKDGSYENVMVNGIGKTLKHNKASMSKMQTIVAETLGMDRGERKTNSNKERLEPIEYKRVEKEKELKLLQEQTHSLEQKKNQLIDRHREAEATAKANARIEYIRALAEGGQGAIRGDVEKQVQTIFGAIEFQRKIIDAIVEDTRKFEDAISILNKRKSQSEIDDKIARVEQSIGRYKRNIEKG